MQPSNWSHCAVAAILALALTGCATLVNPGPDEVMVRSTPAGADVYVDGYPAGRTPTLVSLARSGIGEIRLQMQGYETFVFRQRTELNPWLLGNLCLGGLIGLVVDLATGNHRRFLEDEFHVTLTPLHQRADGRSPIVLR